MYRTVRVETFEELVELLDGLDPPRHWERSTVIYDKKTYFIVNIDDAHRYQWNKAG